MGWLERFARRRGPEYLRLLAGIVISYALMIVFNSTVVGGPGRILLLGFLLWTTQRIRGRHRSGRWIAAATALSMIATVWLSLAAPERVASAVVGGLSFVVILVMIGTIARGVAARAEVDTPTVLGVLCIYLLLAMLFATFNQFMASFSNHYLNGTGEVPTPSDLLYFSVITLATVGYGDITPASEIARSVSVVEALTGQLYLVSVVAAVVGGWRGRRTSTGNDGGPPA